MGFFLAFFLFAPTAVLLGTGGGVRTTMADFGAFFSAAAVVFAFVIGCYGIRLRRGENVRKRAYLLGVALAITGIYLYSSNTIYHGMRWMVWYPFKSATGFLEFLLQLGLIAAFVVAPIAIMVRLIEAFAAMRARQSLFSRYDEPPMLRPGSLAESLAILFFPWIALVALVSLEGPRLVEPMSNLIGAKGTAGLLFSSSLPLLAPGAVLLGYAYDRALGWRGTRLRRVVTAASTAALLLAPLIWAKLATSSLNFGALTPKAWREYLVDWQPQLWSPILTGGASMVAIAFLAATASLLATRRGARPLPILATLMLMVAEFAAVRRLVPLLGPTIVPVVAIGATIPAIVWTVFSLLRRRGKEPTSAVRSG